MEFTNSITPLEALTLFVGLLASLSLASERLVLIVRGLWPFLSEDYADDDDNERKKERLRQLTLHALAITAGIATAFLAKPALTDILPSTWTNWYSIVAIGVLVSGGSSFWNSVLSYLKSVKDIKTENAKKLRYERRNRGNPS